VALGRLKRLNFQHFATFGDILKSFSETFHILAVIPETRLALFET
jgi:hypothetical protein